MVQRAINHLHIPVLEGSSVANIPIFHTSNFNVVDSSRFAFLGSIPESMLRNVPASSEVINAYRI